MKKKYKKPNICAIYFGVLDIVTTSGDDWDPTGDNWSDDWGDWSSGSNSAGGFNTSGY